VESTVACVLPPCSTVPTSLKAQRPVAVAAAVAAVV
jgi:starvation-inducible outer membrane lipoprotein